MATLRKSEPDPRLLDAARGIVEGPLLAAIRSVAEDVGQELGVSKLLAAAAIADVIETRALRSLTEELVLDAEDAVHEGGLTSGRVQLASLLGTTRQGIERRFARARASRRTQSDA
ncbi:hypothetical protein [Arthrobacter sp. PAMC25284]|uniref:hypothetical protein n=1 Tax=Arthrobacter sp. PAMC25284 TaxID=2861279 RepID=UPI001C63AE76|nr:hypothetical protein [Arthrobacter sp. PAMC25284]QYF88492.1 hypothetical protein KY499_09345 [Arthrobacter sp. PAMC25284]